MIRSASLFTLLATTATILIGAAAPADATITITTSQSDFLASLSTVGEDTFDNLSSRTNAATARSAGAFRYVAQGYPGGLARAGSASDYFLSTASNAASLILTNFSSGVSAIGANFFGTTGSGGIATMPFEIDIVADDLLGNVTVQRILNPTASTFIGFTSTDGFSEIGMLVYDHPTGIYPTINNLFMGTAAAPAAVPEPATWALMLGGFALVGTTMRRKKTVIRFA